MRITTDIDVSRLNSAIRLADKKMSVRPLELVKAAGLFFTQSFAKAMRKSKKNRKTYRFEDTSRRFRKGFRQSYVIYRRGESHPSKFYARRSSDLREFRTITFQGLGKQVIVQAGRMAGLNIPQPTGIGTGARNAAARFAVGQMNIDENRPWVQFQYSARDVVGYPGQRAAKRAIHLASRRVLGFANRVMKEQVEAFKK